MLGVETETVKEGTRGKECSQRGGGERSVRAFAHTFTVGSAPPRSSATPVSGMECEAAVCRGEPSPEAPEPWDTAASSANVRAAASESNGFSTSTIASGKRSHSGI